EIIGDTTEVSFNELLSGIAAIILPDTVTLKLEKLPKVRCDENKTDQMFRNLLLNAVEHGAAKIIEIISSTTPEGVSVSITNDGLPIPKKIRSKIFDTGFTTRSNGGGLGLNIVKRIVDAHQWEIKLESSKKTTFNLFIPLKDIVT
ncbi:MAG: ATP-binding protein, partial [Candidatus Thorarchaeota archaeon]